MYVVRPPRLLIREVGHPDGQHRPEGPCAADPFWLPNLGPGCSDPVKVSKRALIVRGCLCASCLNEETGTTCQDTRIASMVKPLVSELAKGLDGVVTDSLNRLPVNAVAHNLPEQHH